MISSRTLKALEYAKVLEHLASFCVSPAGRAAALALRPLNSAPQATEAALLYDECRTWSSSSRGDGKEFRMVSFPEISGVARFLRSPAAILDLDALWALREVLRLAAQAATSILQQEQNPWPRLSELAASCPIPQSLHIALQRCLADDGQLRDESSPELLLARTELRRLHQTCMRKVKDVALHYNTLYYLQDEFMPLASDRFVLPLNANFKGRLHGTIHDLSEIGVFCYL